MNWRQILLCTALVGGCVWCLGMVEKAYSEEKAVTPRIVSAERGRSPQSEPRALNRGDAETLRMAN